MTTFISYSRVNSEFVVRLAKDLKAAGYDVWLDQLDIPKGARWDDAIEAAVERSSTFMIVLAPESIESQNVKDELSYAIDSGKHILPVVIRPCKIPLRLRRFQYVDFTDKPYKESLSDIKRLLSNTQRIAQAPPPEAPVYEDTGSPSPLISGALPQPEFLAPLESFREPASENKNQLQQFILPVGVAVLALAIVGGAVAFALNRNGASAVPPPSPSITMTLTPAPPTMTPTITPIPAPVEVPDEHGVSMRLVRPSDFIMGSDTGMEDEGQARLLYLDTFYIDKYEVTNSQYRACVTAGACLPPKKLNSSTRAGYYNKPEFNSYPVVYVDWNMARNYCEWRGARLPTEAEWEKAARGPEGSVYPWGEEITCEEANFSGCQKDTAPVSSFADSVSTYGVYNMAGNVYEWVSSLYKAYPYDLFDGREDLEAPGERVLRGGSWLSTDKENEVRSAHREKADPSTAKENIGFRCARTPNESFLDFALVVNTPSNGSTATAFVATSRSHKTKDVSLPTSTPSRTPGSPITVTTKPPVVITTTAPPVILTTTAPPVITTTTAPPVIITTTAPPVIITTVPPCDTGYC